MAASSITGTPDSRGRDHHGAFDTLVPPIIEKIGAWTARARQRRALGGLDDRLLADIGVTRRAAGEEAGKPFWR